MSARGEEGLSASARIALPAKITGIVFWGMMLVGLLAAVVLLHGQEREQLSRNTYAAVVLTQKIRAVLEQHPATAPLQHNRARLLNAIESLRAPLGFEAARLDMADDAVQYGTILPTHSAVSDVLTIGAVPPNQAVRHVRVTVYFPNFAQSVADDRKNILLSIGLVVILFGLILQKILQRLLAEPFANMVACARQSADGDNTARFDEGRSDEFGFLAKFINRALDSSMRQQADLQAALARATQSEIALSREKERAEVTLHSITDAVITATATTTIQYMNPVAERLTGWSNDEARGQPLASVIQIVHEGSGEPLPSPLHACLQSNVVETLAQHAVLLRRDGEQVAIETSAAPMRNDQGQVFGAVMVFQDVRHARRLTRQLSYQASHDALTGLCNRPKFEECLNELLTSVPDHPLEHALFYLDVDQFKIVNDTCGHIAGDELLRQISVALQGGIRKEDILARLGGDEFGVLLKNCPLPQARQIAEKLRQRVKELRFAWQDRIFEIGVSIGVVAITPDNLDSAGILSAADLSCYAAKDKGRNRIHVYQPTDAALAQRHGEMRWATLIVETLNENRFLLFQQRICPVASSGDDVEHFEILLRMRDTDGGIIMPGSFLPAAERYNLMPNIDRWVIRHTFAAIAEGAFGPPRGASRRMVAINLSGASLGDEDLLDFIRANRDEFGISFDDICFEITETVAISNLSRATQLISSLRALGCRFALDDFGSGLSSFAYLKNLPVDYIKIDGGFVKDMSADPIDRAMVEAINQIGQIMKIQTIAEWVENAATLTMLKELGVNYAQGYYVGKPEAILRHNTRLACAEAVK